MLEDRDVKILVIVGLIVQAAAIGLGFTALGWRWPLIAAAVAVALGALLLSRRAWWIPAIVIPIAAWHGMSDAAAWPLRIVFTLEALLQAAVLIFLLTFRMTRLW
ncbi:MAG TPA: hypothetical protein VF950_14105 [Planctomycetota bacterium]